VVVELHHQELTTQEEAAQAGCLPLLHLLPLELHTQLLLVLVVQQTLLEQIQSLQELQMQ
jgi:hypothetical protein